MGTNGGISALVKGEEKANSGKEKREVERRGGKEDPDSGTRAVEKETASGKSECQCEQQSEGIIQRRGCVYVWFS